MKGLTNESREPVPEWMNDPFYIQVLFDLNYDAVFVFDLAGRLLKANAAAEKLTGYLSEEWSALSDSQLFDPEQLRHVREQQAHVGEGEPLCFQSVIMCRDERRIDVRIKMVPIRNAEEVGGFFLIAENITERRETEKRLHKSEELYHMISENVQDIISCGTPDGIVRFISPACKRILGYEPEEMIGRKTIEFYHPEDVASVMAQFASRPPLLDSDAFTCRVLHKDGHYIWMETVLKLVRNETGELEKTIGVGRDITERIEALSELRATKDQLESLIENTVDAIIIFNPEGILIRVNPAYERMFEYSAEEVLGRSFKDLNMIPALELEDVIGYTQQVLQGEAILGVEGKRITKSGRYLDVILSITPIRDRLARVNGWSVTFRDITDRKKTQELLLQSEKLSIAGQLAAGVAHEIRNPLTALKGFVKLMKMSGKENELYLGVMSSELNRIELIVSELLVLAKPQATTYRQKDVTRLLLEVVTLIDTQAIMSNIQVVTHFADDLPWINCDDNQMKQVFINFLKNAIEAMHAGGEIRIEAKRLEERQVLLRFIDEGCGISEDLIARIGEPFYTTKDKGTGLGMMVSKTIIENHGGQMRITSQVGVGTTIELVMPGVEQEG